MSKRTEKALVTIVYLDGGRREFTVSASSGIGIYLSQKAGETGMLHLFNDESSLTIPIAGVVREWMITPAVGDTDG